MDRNDVLSEYSRAVKLGQKQCKELTAAGLSPYPAVLDDLLDNQGNEVIQDVGVVEIPAQKIVGVRSAGRITAFSAGFMPLLDPNSEFAVKWIALCMAHLSDEGIRDPILCYEYLGNFYVQEGNKRVSVLRYFDAPRITGIVKRVVPPVSEEPRIRAYYEFLEFYKHTKLYDVQFRRPGDYKKLLSLLGRQPDEDWTQEERRAFSAGFYFFREAFDAQKGQRPDVLPEEALLLWMEVHPFSQIRQMGSEELKKSLTALWTDVKALSENADIKVEPAPPGQPKVSILSYLMGEDQSHINVAFVHQRDTETSSWVKGHDAGRQYLEEQLGERISVRSYFHADTPEEADRLLELAVEEGAKVVFTTTPQLSRATLKAAVRHPKVRFLNCSAEASYSSVRTYYCRVYEGKFITGAIAGAMARDGRIGYVGSYPILGVPASINAFAMGAQMTNPDARIELRWSCLPGNPVQELIDGGIRVISNRDVPVREGYQPIYGEYGTYRVDDDGLLLPLASPCWMWGKLYKQIVDSVLDGSWNREENRPVNEWWGMKSGAIDVQLWKHVPEGVAALAKILQQDLKNGTIDPFCRRITAQDGSIKNTGDAHFSPETLLRMDWLCENVNGYIPEFEELVPFARSTVRQLGVYRDRIPMEAEEM